LLKAENTVRMWPGWELVVSLVDSDCRR